MPAPFEAGQSTTISDAPKGRVHVIGPHFSAELALVTVPGGGVAGMGIGEVTVEVPPGEYCAIATLGGAREEHRVNVTANLAPVVHQFKLRDFRMHSAVPLEHSATSREPHQEAATQYSRTSTWDSGSNDKSSLFAFIRTLDLQRYHRYADGLELLDDQGRLLVRLRGDHVKTDQQFGCVSFRAQLPPGGYLLRRARRSSGSHERVQPLYLCPGRQTEVYLPAQSAPSLRMLSIRMPAFDGGFEASSEDTLAAEAILEGLRRGVNLASHRQCVEQLLAAKFQDPFFGILGATALCLDWPLELSPTQRNELETITGNLAELLWNHPDVRALQLRLRSGDPFPFPPLLRANLRFLRKSAAQNRALVPPGSLTDVVIATPLAPGAWTAWRGLAQLPSPERLNPDGTMVRFAAAGRAIPHAESDAVHLTLQERSEPRAALTPSALYRDAGVPLVRYLPPGERLSPAPEPEDPLLAVDLLFIIRQGAHTSPGRYDPRVFSRSPEETLVAHLFPTGQRERLAPLIAARSDTSTLRVLGMWNMFRESRQWLREPGGLSDERFRVLRAAVLLSLRHLLTGEPNTLEIQSDPEFWPAVIRQGEFGCRARRVLDGPLKECLLRRDTRRGVAEALLEVSGSLLRSLSLAEIHGGWILARTGQSNGNPGGELAYVTSGPADLGFRKYGFPFSSAKGDSLANLIRIEVRAGQWDGEDPFAGPDVLRRLEELELWLGQARHGTGNPEANAQRVRERAMTIERMLRGETESGEDGRTAAPGDEDATGT